MITREGGSPPQARPVPSSNPVPGCGERGGPVPLRPGTGRGRPAEVPWLLGSGDTAWLFKTVVFFVCLLVFLRLENRFKRDVIRKRNDGNFVCIIGPG